MQQATVPAQVKADVPPSTHCSRQSGVTDGEAARAAERLFQACPYGPLRSTTCDFHEGVLVLRGQVTSYYLKQLAQEMVRNVDGVELIVNVLEVNDPRP